MAALHRAIALEQIYDVAVRVAEHLDLDVAGLGDVFLHQHVIVAETRRCLTLARGERIEEVLVPLHQSHALAPAAGRGLDQHRVADLVSLGQQMLWGLFIAVVTRRERHTGRFHELFRLGLRAHRADRRHRWADEDDAGLFAGLAERLVFRQEAVARMDGLRAGGFRRGNDVVDDEIAFARRRRADQDRLIRQPHMARPGIRLGIHRHGANPHAARRFDHAAGNLATVCNQDLVKHQVSPTGCRSRPSGAHATERVVV